MLDEAHKKFLSDVVRVTEAQESFFNVLEKQHAKFTSSDFNKEGKEKSIAGMKLGSHDICYYI